MSHRNIYKSADAPHVNTGGRQVSITYKKNPLTIRLQHFFTKASVSLRRIENFLKLDERDLNCVKHNLPNDIALQIVNGTFTWSEEEPEVIYGVEMEVRQPERYLNRKWEKKRHRCTQPYIVISLITY